MLSSSSKAFSSVTTLVSSPPISPKSFVFTFSSAVSEKSAIFFCVPAPYCKIIVEFVKSICSEKDATIAFSSSESMLSSNSSFDSSTTTTSVAFSSANGSNVNVGAACIVSNSFVIIFFLQLYFLFNPSSFKPSWASMVFNTDISDETSHAVSWNRLSKSFSNAIFNVSNVASISFLAV